MAGSELSADVDDDVVASAGADSVVTMERVHFLSPSVYRVVVVYKERQNYSVSQ